ncbi:hypothetical protein M3Y95_00355900 [Aphelenchoides besseyi]|nr:hypothetical protein M3Y95_00355900 [Aphelenchoides besseyi]
MDVEFSDENALSLSSCLPFTVDGRFFFGNTYNPPYIIDFFHCRNKTLSFDFSNAKDVEPSLNLIRLSTLTGEQIEKKTIGWELFYEPGTHFYNHTFCCVGKTLFNFVHCIREKKSQILSLDLDNLEWKKTAMVFDGYVQSLHTDGDRTLVVSVADTTNSTNRVYRFVFNEPDRLYDLVWLRLKRIFDVQPEAYNFIFSQLPSRFKPISPF